MPTAGVEKKTWLNSIVEDILNKIEPGASEHILFCSLGSRNSKVKQLVEVRLDNRELVIKIRKQFDEKKKAGQDFGHIFISNSVTLATRIRVDILRAMAEHHTTEIETLSVAE
jgi:hypothetical protein